MQGTTGKHKRRIGTILLEYGLITQEQLVKALDRQIHQGGRLGSIFEDMRYVDNDTLLNVLSKQCDIPFVNLFEVKVPPDILKLVPFEQVRSLKVLPFKKSDNTLSLAMVNPDDTTAIQNIEYLTGSSVKAFIALHYQMDKAINSFEKEGYGDLLFDGEKIREDKTVIGYKIPSVHTLLKLVVDFNATDLHLAAGTQPSIRINNDLKRLSMPSITSAQMKDFASEILKKEQMEEFEREKELDFVFSLSDAGRFRINLYKQRNSITLSARLIFENIPSIPELNLPEWITDYALKPQGLILIAGLSGHGKTTTIAVLVDVINSNRKCNIVKLEDPIVYLHKHKKSNVNQREIGIDTESFSAGLKHILRQAPDVIVIDELREPESIEITLYAAEKGRLIISSLNSLNTISAIEKILNIFPEHKQPRIRTQLADNLLLIFSQKLLPKKEGDGKILAHGKLINSYRMSNLIREGRVTNIKTLVNIPSEDISSIDHNIARLCLQDKITFEDGLIFADSPTYYRGLITSGRV